MLGLLTETIKFEWLSLCVCLSVCAKVKHENKNKLEK